MSLFDNLMNQANDLAGKFGITPEQVQAVLATIQRKVGDGSSQMAAIQEAAREHGLPVEKIQELLGHAGGGSDDLVGKLSGLAGGLFNKS